MVRHEEQFEEVKLGFRNLWMHVTIFWHFIHKTINWLIENNRQKDLYKKKMLVASHCRNIAEQKTSLFDLTFNPNQYCLLLYFSYLVYRFTSAGFWNSFKWNYPFELFQNHSHALWRKGIQKKRVKQMSEMFKILKK